MAGWRTAGTNRRAEESLDSTQEEHAHAGLPPSQGRQGGEKTALVAASCWVSY